MTVSQSSAAIYEGTVIHARLRPIPHRLSYRVFSLLLDVDRIDEAFASCRWISRNRFNLYSHYDRDHGAGDGETVGAHARRLFADAGLDFGNGRVHLLAYPRILGTVFNPLSVFYASFEDGRLAGLIYEVSNTFGERRSYVVRAGEAADGIYAQACQKELFVSPFVSATGRYGFRVTAPGDELLLGVQFRDSLGPLLRTHFKATGSPLTDRTLVALMARYPLLTLKVVGGIHYEALKLWLKGVPLERRPRSSSYSVTNVPAETR